jgi:UPF0755 protein
MKKAIRFILILTVIIGAVGAWLCLGSITQFDTPNRYFIIPENGTSKEQVLAILEKDAGLSGTTGISIIAGLSNTWSRIKPGKYEVKKGENAYAIVRMLRNARQAQIKLVINKLRLKEDLAKLIGKQFSTDSTRVMTYLQSSDSLQSLGVDTTQFFSIIIPDTYIFYWNTPLPRILRKLKENSDLFWTKNNRQEKADAKGLTREQVYTLASIVEEETNFDSDKGNIASVYLNRLDKGMPLQACPTIKYAMKDFSITRIYEKYLVNPSPYNTYQRKGLPPGPICTPSPKTIDQVLDAPATNYLFFVAKSDFSGYHHFSSNFAEHDLYAKEYQKALDAYMAKKQQ